MAKKRTRGHYCWSCDEMRPNEKFSGRGHARHLCGDCAKLGEDELEYRQGVRDIERVLRGREIIGRKLRPAVERFLSHPSERVRAYAAERIAASERAREEARQLAASDAEAEELMYAQWVRSDD